MKNLIYLMMFFSLNLTQALAEAPFVKSVELQNVSEVNTWKDSKVLVMFWATWCGDCKEKITSTLPPLVKDGLKLVLVNTEKEPERAKDFLLKNNVSFSSYSDLSRDLRKELKVFSVPGWAVYSVNAEGQWNSIKSGNGFEKSEVNKALGKELF